MAKLSEYGKIPHKRLQRPKKLVGNSKRRTLVTIKHTPAVMFKTIAIFYIVLNNFYSLFNALLYTQYHTCTLHGKKLTTLNDAIVE